MPKISVVLPTYNSERFLDRTIGSVLNQTYKDWELVIVDDCSEDNTNEIIKKWEDSDRRIRSVFLDKNHGGPAVPRNVGIEDSGGEFVAFLDHDDELLPGKLQSQLDFLEDENNRDCAMVTCDAVIDIAGKTYEYITPLYKKEDQLSRLLDGCFVNSCSSILVRKEAFNKIGGFDESLKMSDDMDFYIRLLASGYRIGVVSKMLFIWHSEKNSASKAVLTLKGAEELKYIINKQRGIFTHYEKYSTRLRSLSVLYFLGGEFKIGRMYAKESFRLKRRLAVLLLILASFLHSRSVFRLALYIRRKIKGNVLDRSLAIP